MNFINSHCLLLDILFILFMYKNEWLAQLYMTVH